MPGLKCHLSSRLFTTAKWFGCNVGQAVLPAFRGVRPILSHLLSVVGVFDALWDELQLVWPIVEYSARQAEAYPTRGPHETETLQMEGSNYD